MHIDIDSTAKPRQMLVDGIIQHLKNAMMQPPLVRITDVHPRAFPHRFQALQLVYFGRIVLIRILGHKYAKKIASNHPDETAYRHRNWTPEIRPKIYEIAGKTQIYFNATFSTSTTTYSVPDWRGPKGIVERVQSLA